VCLMPVNPEDYNSDAISGEKLRALMQDEVYDRLKGDVPESIAVFLCSLKAQVDSIQKAISEKNLGECVADSINSQSLKVGGTDVKTKQTAKSNPTSSGTAISFVDSVTQNENGELTATRKSVRSATTSQTGVVQLTDSHSSTSTSTAATPKNVKEAYDLANGKADPASVVDSATYDSSSHTIVFKHGSTQLFTLDAAAFVKDGMVDSVAISNGNLVITFNTDAGKQPISIPLTDIFNPNNYYTKSATDILLASKVDSTDSRLLPDADVALIVYGDATYSSVKALYNAGKKLYLVTGGNIQPSGKFEYRIPLTLITYDANNEVNAFYFEYAQDDRAGASEVGSIAVYRLDSTGWTTTPKQVGYAVNAGHAATADNATNATNDHGGAKIRDAYISNVIDSVYDATNPPQYIYSFDGVSVAANQDGFRIATLSRYKIPFPRVYFHTRSELTVRNPTDPSSTTPDNCAYIINNSIASLGYNGFTCLGHEKPIGYGQKYYGVCSTDLIGGLTEIDFDFSATWVNHTMEQQNFPPSFMQIVFAATWDENDFQQYPNCGYGFALNHENIFTTTRGSYRFEYGTLGFNNDMPVMGHVRMVGVIGNAGLRRLFIGAFQPRSDAYIKMKISNVRVRGNLGAMEASVM
jgi:hypothetical protein